MLSAGGARGVASAGCRPARGLRRSTDRVEEVTTWVAALLGAVVVDRTVRARVPVRVGLVQATAVAGAWTLVCAAVDRVNAARWEREWARVEPRWSGRTP